MPPEKSKRPHVLEHEADGLSSLEPSFKVPCRSPREDKEIHQKLQQVRARIREKEEVLRKLNMVKVYRTKRETQDLDIVTSQWLRVCQEALQDLRVKVREVRTQDTGEEELTLKSLIDNLGIDTQLIQLDETEDCFTT